MSLSTNTTSPPQYSSSPQQSSRGLPRPAAPSRQSFDRPPTAQRMSHTSEQHGAYEAAADADTNTLPHDDGGRHEPSPATQSSFQPFFTLIEDANTSEYYHPTVHYIFSDDDADIVTEAALRALEAEQDTAPDPGKGKTKSSRDQPPTSQADPEDANAYPEHSDSEPLTPRKESLLPPPIPGIRDNYIILDMEPALDGANHSALDAARGAAGLRSISFSPAAQGMPLPHQQQHQQQQQGSPAPPPQFTITSADSLTPAWQVLNTQLMPAPTFENHASGEQPSSNGGLMLKIHGTAGLPVTMFGKDRDKERGSQRLEEMMEQFEKRLGELRQVIQAGDHAPPAQDGLFEDHGGLDDPEANVGSGLNVDQSNEARSAASKNEAGTEINL
ncbi:uncharacterized protein ACLA_066180 [Aspergillus clavatus NRRL 1]|uniref:Anaphase promoting complex subunit 11 n=1 Tax=Aspergillus clavatus (strain ATCC 1007 / CBS 513.65 / DSM 816 / NCTC 3887 / NRRL 1 / QM 1276 / 107) TaxID=344612 RepID=A1CGA2_ASPCL|nr:uncharacterized protein ACLA_066180 [Aspergillus clavatus NRRL 1]EAW10982.1 conserved hypothetical protein [Aspergillus clavatus NRRL 1]